MRRPLRSANKVCTGLLDAELTRPNEAENDSTPFRLRPVRAFLFRQVDGHAPDASAKSTEDEPEPALDGHSQLCTGFPIQPADSQLHE
jgi:hypothetical protein